MNASFFEKIGQQLQRLLSGSKHCCRKVYWVIEESEDPKNASIVKYYNEQNELLHEERLGREMESGIIDEHLISRLQATQLRIQRQAG